MKKTPGAQYGEILDWSSEAQYVFSIGKTGKVTDPVSGKSFMIKRTMGANHSDTEPLTAQDTKTMKEIFGGAWSWDRKIFMLEVDGREISRFHIRNAPCGRRWRAVFCRMWTTGAITMARDRTMTQYQETE